MEGLITKGVIALGSQGTGWILFCFACAAATWLFLKLQREQQKCLDVRETLAEKRIEEARHTVEVLNTASIANQRLAESITARTETMNRVAALMEQMTETYRTNDVYWRERFARLEEVVGRLERRPPSGGP